MIAQLFKEFAALFVVTEPGAGASRRDLMILALIVLAGAVIRFWGLGAVGLHGDEKTMALPVMNLVIHGEPIMPSGMFYPRAVAQLYLMAGSVMAFGQSEWALRLPSALCGVLLIVLTWKVGARFLTPLWSLALAAAVAFLPNFIEDSQTARMYVFLVTCVAGYLALVFAWERTGRVGYLAAAAVTILVGIQFHTLAIFAAFLVLFPGLVRGDARLFWWGVVAFVVIVGGFAAINWLIGHAYPQTVESDAGAVVNGPHAAVVPHLKRWWLVLAAAPALVVARWALGRGRPHWGFPRWPLGRGTLATVLLAGALLAEVALAWHLAVMLTVVGLVLAARAGRDATIALGAGVVTERGVTMAHGAEARLAGRDVAVARGADARLAGRDVAVARGADARLAARDAAVARGADARLVARGVGAARGADAQGAGREVAMPWNADAQVWRDPDALAALGVAAALGGDALVEPAVAVARGLSWLRLAVFLGVSVVIAAAEGVFLVTHAAGSPKQILGLMLGWPSVWPFIAIADYSALVMLAAVGSLAGAAWLLARRRAVPDHVLLLVLGVWVPLLMIGFIKWNIPSRYAAAQIVPLLVAGFAAMEWGVASLAKWARARPAQVVPWWAPAIAPLAFLLVVNPLRVVAAVDSGYTSHPDHKGAAEFIARVHPGPRDIIIAEDVLQQTYYLGHVDYWLVNKQVAAPFMHKVNGRWLDFYTDTPLIGTGSELERLVEEPNRGAIYVIGSGENQSDGRSLMRAFGIAEALRSPAFHRVYRGRDGLTEVWKVDPPSPTVARGH